MSLKKIVTRMAVAFAVAKGAEAFRKAGGLEGVKRKLPSSGGSQRGGGIGDLLGQLGLDGSGARGSGLGGLLGGLAGAGGGTAGAGRMQGLLDTTRETPEDTPEEEQVSGLMLRAMLQAARADGEIDAAERAALIEAIGEASPEEEAFLQRQMEVPVNPESLARDTPAGHEIEIYTAAVLAIEPDNRAEAEFLDRLAQGLRLEQRVVNEIHASQGKPPLYTA